MNSYEELLHSPLHRRAFLQRMSAAGLGAAAVSLLAGCGGSDISPDSVVTPTPDVIFDPTNFPGIPGRNADETVLNYALTLEILEADLYRQAVNLVSGRSPSAQLDRDAPSDLNDTGDYSLLISPGNLSAQATDAGFKYLVQYAYVEAAHRDFLRTALQSLGAPVVSANPLGYTAPFGTTLESILNTIYLVEETGVRAYLGAAGFMSTANRAQLLTTAVAIHSTEARHSAAIAYILGKPVGPTYLPGDKNPLNRQSTPNPAPFSENTFQYYLDPPTVISAVQPFIVKAS